MFRIMLFSGLALLIALGCSPKQPVQKDPWTEPAPTDYSAESDTLTYDFLTESSAEVVETAPAEADLPVLEEEAAASSGASAAGGVAAGTAAGEKESVRFPHFLPDGKAVLYTSDLTGYSNMYLVEIGEFDDLPDLEQTKVHAPKSSRQSVSRSRPL